MSPSDGQVPILRFVLDPYYRFLQRALVVLMGVMLIPVTLQILSRYTGWLPRYIWTEEAARFCFVWIVMIGSGIAVRDGAHFDVDLWPASKTPRQQGLRNLVVHVAMLILAIVFVSYGVAFAQLGARQTSEMSGINMLAIYISFPIAGANWALFLGEHLYRDLQTIRGKEPGNPSPLSGAATPEESL